MSTLASDTPSDTVFPRVDAHTHVFRRDLPMAAQRRYAPRRDATPADLFAHLDAHRLERAVLVQPSFLGTDNSHLLAAIAAAPDRLRGIAMVAPDVTDAHLHALDEQGIAGVRLNLIDSAVPDLDVEPWSSLLRRIAALGWHVELHRQARDLPPLIESALQAGVRVVVDHHGRPDPRAGLDDPGLAALLAFGSSRRVWVKLSAPYRCAPRSASFANEAALRFVAAFGADRLLWGSDWPHTQCETLADVAASLRAVQEALNNARDLAAVLGGTAAELYGFPQRPAQRRPEVGGVATPSRSISP